MKSCSSLSGEFVESASLNYHKIARQFNAVEVFFAGFIPPLVGSVSAILIALIFHNDAISNYNWQCGRARLPSLSRIINLSVERTFWQLFLLFHVPIRVIELITGCK
ncbi:unnamed protein product [Haemonchus placei]|uniref:Anoctamin n=1 Tax=Haemonchus placei TaxID=6290 RepID=A0A0N4XA07_HAEPC|nr:unnamed protein product [Haemonchus placei]